MIIVLTEVRELIFSIAHHRVPSFLIFAIAGQFALFSMTACNRLPQLPVAAMSTTAHSYEFHGIWTAAGSRNTMHLVGDRRASISTFNGSLLLAGASRPDVGFRSEAIVFSDSATGMIGRSVWTDEHGDQVVSELQGEGTADKNEITGTFIGGTGRYSGATGTYQFSWRFILENEDGIVQGQSQGLSGRIQLASPQVASTAGWPSS